MDLNYVENLDLSGIAVAMKGIVKQFPSVLANDHVNFEVRKGEIHALVEKTVPGKPP